MTSSIAVRHNNVGTTQSKLCHRISLADQSYVADMSVLGNEQIMPTVGIELSYRPATVVGSIQLG